MKIPAFLRRRSVFSACVGAALLAGLFPLLAADGKKAEAPKTDEAAAMEAISPGPSHKLLEKYTGEWTIHTKLWMDPSGDPVESDGTGTAKWIMGGRYVEMNIRATMMGQLFEGRSINGYDNIKKCYNGFWIDNMGTGMTLTTGTAAADGKSLTSTGKIDDPFAGKTGQDVKFVDRFVSADEIVSEMYIKADGKEVKVMEMTYKRKK